MIAGTAFYFEEFERAWWLASDRAYRRSGSSEEVVREIRDGCRRGESLCLRCPDGVVILALVGLEEGGFEAQCLLAVSTASPGAFKRQEGDMLKLARELGAERLAFKTDRPGWRRLLGPEWQVAEDTFVRSVP